MLTQTLWRELAHNNVASFKVISLDHLRIRSFNLTFFNVFFSPIRGGKNKKLVYEVFISHMVGFGVADALLRNIKLWTS